MNNYIIKKYKDGEYLQKQAKVLTDLTLQRDYISNYNYGNILYQNGEYEKAVEEYEQAIKTVPVSEEECKVRINCALAICKSVEIDENDQNSIEDAIKEYEQAVSVLTENDCYKRNRDAKKLKEDIEKEIERLKKKQNSSKPDDENNPKEETNQPNEGTIEEKIQEIKEGAINEQRKKEELYDGFNRDYTRVERNW